MRFLPLACLAACSAATSQMAPDAASAATDPAIPDVRCSAAPGVPATDFRHTTSEMVAELGEPRHRGVDLIAAASDATQVLSGALAYSDLDKALEDEDVRIFACEAGQWRDLGTTRTDGDGRFAMTLSGDARLGVGLRDLFAAAPDATGVWFLALVAPDGSRVVVSDVDGTLTSSENAFPISTVLATSVGAQPGAADQLAAAATAGITPIYVTARGDLYTASTRQWLADHGFPRAPLHLAPGVVTLPGSSTVAFKQSFVSPLVERFDIAAAIGNRATDITAYADAGIAADRILIKLPEFTEELSAPLSSHLAIGFSAYDQLPVQW
jgi:hypothetical protein